MTDPGRIDAYHRALEEEKELSDRIRGREPGSPLHDPELWQRWLEVVEANKALYQSLIEGRPADE